MKKKLDEMTVDEIKQLESKYCKRSLCRDCPLNANDFQCLTQFPYWKKMYEKYKDKEIEVDVEKVPQISSKEK